MHVDRGAVLALDRADHDVKVCGTRPSNEFEHQRPADAGTPLAVAYVHRMLDGMAIALMRAPRAVAGIAGNLAVVVDGYQHRVALPLAFFQPGSAVVQIHGVVVPDGGAVEDGS